MLSLALVTLSLAIGPFTGPVPSGGLPGTTRFSVSVRGKSGQAVRLRAVGVPAGYIASFCTPRVCAPFHVSFALPKSGRQSIELQLIENEPGAREPTKVTIAADGAPSVSVSVSHAR